MKMFESNNKILAVKIDLITAIKKETNDNQLKIWVLGHESPYIFTYRNIEELNESYDRLMSEINETNGLKNNNNVRYVDIQI